MDFTELAKGVEKVDREKTRLLHHLSHALVHLGRIGNVAHLVDHTPNLLTTAEGPKRREDVLYASWGLFISLIHLMNKLDVRPEELEAMLLTYIETGKYPVKKQEEVKQDVVPSSGTA